MEISVSRGDVSTEEFCQIAGILAPNLSVIRSGNRYFTIDNIFRIGQYFNLDMNTLIYGTGPLKRKKATDQTPLEILKEMVARLEIESETASNRTYNKKGVKEHKTKKDI